MDFLTKTQLKSRQFVILLLENSWKQAKLGKGPKTPLDLRPYRFASCVWALSFVLRFQKQSLMQVIENLWPHPVNHAIRDAADVKLKALTCCPA